VNWKSEEGQKILAVAYALQSNCSNAASYPKELIRELVDGEVYRGYSYELGKWVYDLQPIEKNGQGVKSARIVSKGRKAIPDETIRKIKEMRLEGCSVRFIAEELKVGCGTVGKYMK